MEFKLTKQNSYIHILFFTVTILLSYTTNFELQFGVWFLIALIYFFGSYSKQFLIFIGCYILILALGVFRSFFYDHNNYAILRDFTYFLKPILGFIIGYQIFKNRAINVLKLIIYISLGLAIFHLFKLTLYAMLGDIHRIEDIRSIGGFFSDVEVFAFVFLLFNKSFNLGFSKKTRLILLSVIGVSVILYFARTNIIQFVILTFGLLGYYKLTVRNLILFTILVGIGILSYSLIANANPRRNAQGIENFLYKIKNAPYEIYDPYVVNDNSSRFHDRFRSYETKITIKQMKNREDMGLWIGNGFGSLVNYGTKINTTDGHQVKYAPILHNGYTTVFLKVGLLGLSIFIFSLLYLSFFGFPSKNTEINNIRTLINSTGIFMFLSTLVFLGFYLKLDSKSVIVGGLIAYYEGMRRVSQ